MEKPRFSVIIPALNEEKFLPKLLVSLALQTKRDFEVIVVDGRSRDKTVAVAQTFAPKLPHLKVIVSPRSSLPLQRNLGVGEARGEWLVFADADGILLPYFIERISKFIGEERPELFTTWFRPDSEKTADALVTLLSNITVESSMSFKRPFAPGPLTIVKKEIFMAVNGYDEALTFGEDVDFSKRVVEAGYSLKVLRETLCVWSLRRFRNEGTLKVMQSYAKTAFSVLLTRRAPKHMSGYIMGGHLYNRAKPKRSTMKKIEHKVRHFIQEAVS